jgi:hypothetical protein
MNYYKIAKAPSATVSSAIKQLQSENRYFILHAGTNALYMTDLVLTDDEKLLQCRVDSLPNVHSLLLRSNSRRYRKNTPEQFVLSEVHIYIPTDTSAVAGSNYTFSLDRVQKIDPIEKDLAKTGRSYFLGGLGITIGIISVVGAIAWAVTWSSAWNGFTMPL